MDAKIDVITSEMPMLELHKIIKNLSLQINTTDTKVLLNQATNTIVFEGINYSYDIFYNDIYQLLKYIPIGNARELITKIKRRVSLLPNTVIDITSYLRKEQLSLLERLEKCEMIDDILYVNDLYTHTEKGLTHWVLKQVWQDISWSDWTLRILQSFEHLKLELPDNYIIDYIWDEDKQAFNKCVEALTILIAIRWLRRQIWVCENVGINRNADSSINIVKHSKLTQSELALYYTYLHISDCMPLFDTHPKGKIAAYQEVTEPYKLSWKAFQIQYNRYLSTPSERKATENIRVIKKVIGMLAPYQKAQKIAYDELKITLSKTS